MIKIARDFKNLSEQHRTKILLDYDIETKLDVKIVNTIDPEKRFYEYLKTNINDILEKDIEYLKTTIIPSIDIILGVNYFDLRDHNDRRKKINKDKTKELIEIFDYTTFSEFNANKYNAYDLLEELEVNVCPYCNRQYINTIKPTSNIGGTRATLDHYLLKSKYPYLGLSFWNLVPSCYSCNSQLRTSRNIGLHPYQKGFDKILHFYTDIDDITEYIGNTRKYFNLSLKEYKDLIPSQEDLENASINEKVFRLNDIYQNHKEYVRKIIQCAIIYSKSFSKDLLKEYPEIFENEEDAQSMMLSFYTKKENYEEKPLAKLTHDIASELKLL
jgi:hypothetical protein